jgi:hypothetical protein
MPTVQDNTTAADGRVNDWGPGREPFRDGTTDPAWSRGGGSR